MIYGLDVALAVLSLRVKDRTREELRGKADELAEFSSSIGSLAETVTARGEERVGFKAANARQRSYIDRVRRLLGSATMPPEGLGTVERFYLYELLVIDVFTAVSEDARTECLVSLAAAVESCPDGPTRRSMDGLREIIRTSTATLARDEAAYDQLREEFG